MTNLERLHVRILASDLSEAAKNELAGILQFVGDDHLAELAQYFDQGNDTIQLFHRNITAKHRALREGDRDGMKQILKEERELVQKMKQKK